MCRLYGFRGSAPARLACGLVHAQNALLVQSEADGRGFSNADGWGIGFYENGRPVLRKSHGAAFGDREYRRVAESVRSPTVLAHVRQATVGEVSRVNTQPFRCGIWMFCHNGTLAAFEQLAPVLERQTASEFLETRRGTTDSELIFLWLMSRMEDAGIASEATCQDPSQLAQVLEKAVGDLAARSVSAGAESPTTLNFLLTDGATLAAARWGNSLFHLLRARVHDCGLCGEPHVDRSNARNYQAGAVASEPVTAATWDEVPERSLVTIGPNMEILRGPIRSRLR